MPPRRRTCRYCGEELPVEASRSRKFCNATCRSNARYKAKRIITENNKNRKGTPRYVEEMIRLAFGAKSEDVIREVFREEIRENITTAVRDNVLGAAEVMTQMLPRALAGMAEDLKSEDWIIRSRAQALLLKYAMSQDKKDVTREDLGRLTVIHEVAVPDTPLGERVVAELEANDAIDVEEFEKDWPSCSQCYERKHPDSMYYASAGRDVSRRWICKSCQMHAKIAAGRVESTHSDFSSKLYDPDR